MESATPFGRTVGASAAHRCKWCDVTLEYLLTPAPATPDGQGRRVRVYVCPLCDNRPPQ